jgi:multidrug efflux pump
MLFGLALLFTFLVLAAQFESWIHPITIFTGIILAVSGGLIVLYCSRFFGPALTDNIFSKFGLIMLIGMVSKNGILVVEFANQLQVEGRSAFDAAYEASTVRFRPILMTSISTVLGAVPIAFASGRCRRPHHRNIPYLVCRADRIRADGSVVRESHRPLERAWFDSRG